jgi:hypothetical protein
MLEYLFDSVPDFYLRVQIHGNIKESVEAGETGCRPLKPWIDDNLACFGNALINGASITTGSAQYKL